MTHAAANVGRVSALGLAIIVLLVIALGIVLGGRRKAEGGRRKSKA